MIEILSCVLHNDICIILTRSLFKFENNLDDLNLSNLISDSTALLYQRSNETTKKNIYDRFRIRSHII